MKNKTSFYAHVLKPETAELYYRYNGFICPEGSKVARQLENPAETINGGDDLSMVQIKSRVHLDRPVYSWEDLMEQI